MEITFYEDPACSWCWAFQPAYTRFVFEFGGFLKPRRVMGGLRDLPVADVNFVIQQWKKAEVVSGMPFDPRIWKKHVLRTTFVACRAVKAASMVHEVAGLRLLRRLREAQFVEQIPIDDVETIVQLGTEVGIDGDRLRENLASGRAETLFARDRAEAAQFGFGFPTIVLRTGPQEEPTVLQGAVPYGDLLHALLEKGVPAKYRRKFRDTGEHWAALLSVHPRLALAEIQKVTQIEKARLLVRLEQLQIRKRGAFYELASRPSGADGIAGETLAACPTEPGDVVVPRRGAAGLATATEPVRNEPLRKEPTLGARSVRDGATPSSADDEPAG